MLGMQIPLVTLDDAAIAAAGDDAAEDEGRERGRGRSRGGRGGERRSEGSGRGGGRGRGRGERTQRAEKPATIEAAAVEPEEAELPDEEIEESVDEIIEQQEVVPFGRQRDDGVRKPAAARGERSERRGRGRDRGDAADGADQALGESAFGDHVPAFMLRSSKVA
jgi:hypothetical protein